MKLFKFVFSTIITVVWFWAANKAYTKKKDKFDTIFYAALGGFWIHTALDIAIQLFVS